MSRLAVGARSAWAEAAIEDFLRDYRAPLRVAGQGASGFPLLCSLWSRYEAGVLWCASQRDAAIVRCLERDPRCAFELAPNEPPYRGVRGRGRAAIHPDAGPRVLGELLERYQGGRDGALARWLLARADTEVAIAIEVEWVTAWDYTERMSG